MTGNYKKKTMDYLDSFPRKVANKLIKFEMDNNYSQKQAAEVLGLNFDELLQVEFNTPGTPDDLYKRVNNILDLTINDDPLLYNISSSVLIDWNHITMVEQDHSSSSFFDINLPESQSKSQIKKFKKTDLEKNKEFDTIEEGGVAYCG